MLSKRLMSPTHMLRTGAHRRLLPLLLLPALGCSPGSIVINEFVASNIEGITDSEGGTPDWIELGNRTDGDVSLDGWFLSDDEDTPQRHSLDGLVVPAGGYLVLLASGDVSRGDDHLSFRLSRDGEMVILSDGDGVVDDVAYGAQEGDLALARVPDMTGRWAAAEPSPGRANE